MRQLEYGRSLTHESVMLFYMESPSVCPQGPCQAEPYSRYSRWHAEGNDVQCTTQTLLKVQKCMLCIMDIMHIATKFGMMYLNCVCKM